MQPEFTMQSNPKMWITDFFDWLYGTAYDSLPYTISKDGYSAFNALATFALAQGAALTVVAKGEGREGLVLTIYAAAVFLTVLWIRAMLCSERLEIIGNPPRNTTYRAYDKPSIRYGRWTLTWTLVVGLVMLFLGYNQLLPNQTRRVAFLPKGTIECEVWLMLDRLQETAKGNTRREQRSLGQWVTWMAEANSSDAKKRLLWIEQKTDFKDNYKTFFAKLEYAREQYELGDRVAFLVSPSIGYNPPVYRQLSFRLDDKRFTDFLEVFEPNPNDYLLIIAVITHKERKDVTGETADYKIHLSLSR
jgi:hypothetical protein